MLAASPLLTDCRNARSSPGRSGAGPRRSLPSRPSRLRARCGSPSAHDRIESLQQQRPQQPLRSNRQAAAVGVELENSPFSAASTSFTSVRIARSGCAAGSRSSISTYEHSSPLGLSEPRIKAPPCLSQHGIIFVTPCQQAGFQQPASASRPWRCAASPPSARGRPGRTCRSRDGRSTPRLPLRPTSPCRVPRGGSACA